jgi:hypothetical protein
MDSIAATIWPSQTTLPLGLHDRLNLGHIVSTNRHGEFGPADCPNRTLNPDTSCQGCPDQPCEPHDNGQLPPNLQLDRRQLAGPYECFAAR